MQSPSNSLSGLQLWKSGPGDSSLTCPAPAGINLAEFRDRLVQAMIAGTPPPENGQKGRLQRRSDGKDVSGSQDDCKVHAEPRMVSLSNHDLLDLAPFDKRKMSRSEWMALLCNRPVRFRAVLASLASPRIR